MRTIIRRNYTPRINDYHDTNVYDEANHKIYQFDCDGVFLDISSSAPVVDNVMSDTSENAVQNKVIKEYVDSASDVLSGRIDDLDEGYTDLDNKITEEANTRAEQDGILGQSIADEAALRSEGDTAITGKLDRNVVTDIAINTSTSTSVIKLNESKVNLNTGVVSPEEVVFPVADETTAGMMNSSTFQSVATNSSNIESLMNGAVMTTLLIAEPTQQQILTAWQLSSGKTTPLNSASVWDSINHKRYVYFSSQNQWVMTQEGLGGEGVTVSQWTNTSAGIAKGSTNVGQIFAESDGTGSVNGWDQLRSDATVALEKATNNETTIAGKQDKLTAGVGIDITNNVISNTQTSAEWGNITGTLSDQEDLQSELDKKIEAEDPTETEEIESVVTTSMIADGAVTEEKLSISLPKFTFTTTDPGKNTPLGDNEFIAVYEV